MSAYYKDYESASAHLETLGLAFHEIEVHNDANLWLVVHDDPARHKARSLTKYILASGRSPREAFNSAMKTLEPRKPVVARNDAAELRAAIAKMADLFLKVHHHIDDEYVYVPLGCRLAWEELHDLALKHDNLHRLAGEDNT